PSAPRKCSSPSVAPSRLRDGSTPWIFALRRPRARPCFSRRKHRPISEAIMRTDEQIAPSLDPLDGFLISGTRARSDSPRLIDRGGFLASPPIPNEPRPAQEESGDAPDAKVPSLAASVDGARQETRLRTSMDEDRRIIGAVTVEPPRFKAGF